MVLIVLIKISSSIYGFGIQYFECSNTQTSLIIMSNKGRLPASGECSNISYRLISNNLNTRTIESTDDNSSATTVDGSINTNTNITFAVVLHIVDYIDPKDTIRIKKLNYIQ